MDTFCVYCHTAPSGKMYIGISKDPIKRWNSGKGYINNYLFFKAIQKYGWNAIHHEILASGLSEEEAKAMEVKLISEKKLTDPKYGYNLRDGGDGPFSENSRRLMSESRKGNDNCVGRTLSESTRSQISTSLRNYYKLHSPSFLGKKHSKETIKKMKSRTVSDETRIKMSHNHADVSGSKNPSAKPIRQLSLSGEKIHDYEYAKLAAEENGLDLSAIIRCCRGKAKTCGGFKWQYL